MKKLIQTVSILLACIGMSQSSRAQDCNANFTFTVDTESSMLWSFAANGLADGTILTTFWFLDGFMVGTSPELLHSFAEVGSYEICLRVVSTDEDTCTRCLNICVDTGYVIDESTMGISTTDIEEGIDIYPNPAMDRITISLEHRSLKDAHIRINDVLGRAVHNEKVEGTSSQFNIEVGELADGMYTIELYSEGKTYRAKFLKQK